MDAGGRNHHKHADAAPAGHNRHRRSPRLHAAHQPAASLCLKDEPQPVPRDPSIVDSRGRDDEPGRRSDRGQRHEPRVAAALGRRGLSALPDQLAAEPGGDRVHPAGASPAVREPQIREQEPRSDDARGTQICRRHRRAHRRRQRPSRRRARPVRRDRHPPASTAPRTSLERQRRDRTGKQQHRRRSHDDAARARRKTVDRGKHPSGHDSRVGMEPRQPRPAAGNSGRRRPAALSRSRHAP